MSSTVARRVAGALIAGVLMIAPACRRSEPRPAGKTTIRLMTGTPGGGFYPLGAELAGAFAKGVPSLALDHRESAGSISNVTALERGETEIAFAYADVAWLAFTGGLESQKSRFSHLRGVAVLQLAPVHLVVSRNSGIRDVTGLRGRRVGLGTSGSGTTLTATLILRAFGIEASSIGAQMLRYDEAADRLASGDLDAMFVIGNDPVDAVRTALAAGGRFIPLSGAAVDRLRHEYPFFHVALIRRGAYPGQNEPVRTLAIENLLLCRDTLPEGVVHDLTGRLFEVQPSVTPLSGMDLAHAPAVPIPLHEGAARFYREREIFR